MSDQLREMINISRQFLKRPTYRRRPSMCHRVLYTARYMLRAGVEDGQYIPDVGLYKEFKNWFFRKGTCKKADFENRWFFYYVRECMVQFRREALHVDYEPW